MEKVMVGKVALLQALVKITEAGDVLTELLSKVPPFITDEQLIQGLRESNEFYARPEVKEQAKEAIIAVRKKLQAAPVAPVVPAKVYTRGEPQARIPSEWKQIAVLPQNNKWENTRTGEIAYVKKGKIPGQSRLGQRKGIPASRANIWSPEEKEGISRLGVALKEIRLSKRLTQARAVGAMNKMIPYVSSGVIRKNPSTSSALSAWETGNCCPSARQLAELLSVLAPTNKKYVEEHIYGNLPNRIAQELKDLDINLYDVCAGIPPEREMAADEVNIPNVDHTIFPDVVVTEEPFKHNVRALPRKLAIAVIGVSPESKWNALHSRHFISTYKDMTEALSIVGSNPDYIVMATGEEVSSALRGFNIAMLPTGGQGQMKVSTPRDLHLFLDNYDHAGLTSRHCAVVA